MDVLDEEGLLVFDVEISTTLGLADMDPVDGLEAGSLIAIALDEGFEECGSGVESFSPIVLDAA